MACISALCSPLLHLFCLAVVLLQYHTMLRPGRASRCSNPTLHRRCPRPCRSPLPCCPLTEVQREQKKAEKLIKDAAKRNDLVSAKVCHGRDGGAGAPWGEGMLLRVPAALSAAGRYKGCKGSAQEPPLNTAPARPPTHRQIIAKEVVNMRRTVTKLAMNKATFLSLSNQMTEQLGGWELGGEWAGSWGLHEGGRPSAGGGGGHQGPSVVCGSWLQRRRRSPRLAYRLPHPPPAPVPAPTCAAMTRVAGSLQKSGEVMKLVNNLMKVPQLQRTMMEMSKGERG